MKSYASLLKGVSGRFGNFKITQRPGHTVIQFKPKIKNRLERNRLRFRYAAAYARKQMQHPLIKELYSKGITLKKTSAYTVALTDYMNPPSIDKIFVKFYPQSQACIFIQATDDFMVKEVQIKIYDHSFLLIKQSIAHPMPQRQSWFKHRIDNSENVAKILICVKDYADNISRCELPIGG